MKAITQDRYGSADVLKAQDIDMPDIGDDDVLVRVHAASIHIGDWVLMTGVPYVMRMGTGLSKPKNRVPGTDIAGMVEAVGTQVRSLRPGDEVFGWCTGAFAEYARAPEDQLVKKPAKITFEQAAAVGVSATTALQLLRDDGKVQPGAIFEIGIAFWLIIKGFQPAAVAKGSPVTTDGPSAGPAAAPVAVGS